MSEQGIINMTATKHHCQQGATLPTALILTLVITLLSLSAMRTTLFQEKMSYNTQNREIAFQSAETALQEAETWISTLLTADKSPSCTQYPCVLAFDSTLNYVTKDRAWWLANAAALGSAPGSAGAITGVNAQPMYRVEYQRYVRDDTTIGHEVPTGAHFFKSTARGTGATNDAVTIIQSTSAQRF